MSVIMTLEVSGDPRALEQLPPSEWPDRQSFESFFREQESQIRPMMQAVGATSEPKASFWNLLATHDEFGWGA